MITVASRKQIAYAMRLLQIRRYGTDELRFEHRLLGSRIRDGHATVLEWLASMTPLQISQLIDRLKK